MKVVNKVIRCVLVLMAVGLLLGGGNAVYCIAKTSVKTEKSVQNVRTVTVKKTSKSNQTVKQVKKNGTLKIKCTGDSMTEGLAMPDSHTAVIGGSTYPSILYTMLNANGVDAVVENAGHGGETTAAVVARLGTVPLYTNQDITFNGGTTKETIDKKITAVYSDTLQIPVSFALAFTDMNPVIIDGQSYTAKPVQVSENKWQTFLSKNKKSSPNTIKTGSSVQLSGSRDNDVTIIFAGINDGEDITIEEYVEMLKVAAAACNDNYIILGPHTKMYEKKNFVSGKNSAEKRNNYRKRMTAEFGDRFIDLNTDWCGHALEIAQQNGFFSDLSAKQIKSMQAKLAKREVPVEFIYNKQEGNVHLNKAGYTVIAQLVYERLIKLGYI